MKLRIKLFILVSILFLNSCSLIEKKQTIPQRTVKDQVKMQTEQVDEVNSLRYRLLVLPFIDSDVKRDPLIKELSRKRLISELNKSGKIMALTESELKTKYSPAIENGEYSLQILPLEIGQSGVSGILEGKIVDFRVKKRGNQVGVVKNSKLTLEAQVRVRILNVRNSKELFNTIKTVTLEQEDTRFIERFDITRYIEDHPELVGKMIVESFLEFTSQILDVTKKLQFEGRIAAVQSERIFLNVGRLSGLRIGDILRVLDPNEEVFDPETGRKIGDVQGRLKGTLEVVSFFGQDGAVTVIHSGSGFKENDRVEPY